MGVDEKVWDPQHIGVPMGSAEDEELIPDYETPTSPPVPPTTFNNDLHYRPGGEDVPPAELAEVETTKRQRVRGLLSSPWNRAKRAREKWTSRRAQLREARSARRKKVLGALSDLSLLSAVMDIFGVLTLTAGSIILSTTYFGVPTGLGTGCTTCAMGVFYLSRKIDAGLTDESPAAPNEQAPPNMRQPGGFTA
jgi:hypothetical protein